MRCQEAVVLPAAPVHRGAQQSPGLEGPRRPPPPCALSAMVAASAAPAALGACWMFALSARDCSPSTGGPFDPASARASVQELVASIERSRSANPSLPLCVITPMNATLVHALVASAVDDPSAALFRSEVSVVSTCTGSLTRAPSPVRRRLRTLRRPIHVTHGGGGSSGSAGALARLRKAIQDAQPNQFSPNRRRGGKLLQPPVAPDERQRLQGRSSAAAQARGAAPLLSSACSPCDPLRPHGGAPPGPRDDSSPAAPRHRTDTYAHLATARAAEHVPFAATVVLAGAAALCANATEGLSGVVEYMAQRNRSVALRFARPAGRTAAATLAECRAACLPADSATAAAPDGGGGEAISLAAGGARALGDESERMRCAAECLNREQPGSPPSCAASAAVMLVRRGQQAVEFSRAWVSQVLSAARAPAPASAVGPQLLYASGLAGAKATAACARVVNLPPDALVSAPGPDARPPSASLLGTSSLAVLGCQPPGAGPGAAADGQLPAGGAANCPAHARCCAREGGGCGAHVPAD